MNFWLSVAARWVQGVALSLWLGGVIAIGALAAPAAFHVTRAHAALAGNLALQNDIAGAIIGQAFRNFNVLCIVCGVLLLLSGMAVARLRPSPRVRRLTVISSVVTLILLGLTVYLQYALFPVIDAAKLQQHWPLFDRLHHLYVGITNAQLPLLLVVAWVISLRDTASTSPVSTLSSN
ncbi:hypothetical protein CCAX7_29870 [Capsulimonas corticalis]|uniref:TMEM205-like domain-containing protein n=1 Tax=Capsulimonas corticalis TaxID=2219043 RepID=A0A402CSX5_9BACT|nr:DUF4149 domain-containing protein [Capsulimonas corticalis]BDI30936.1 hypothetical protein CCAX7_29870 [Capsulimonas corticalis]